MNTKKCTKCGEIKNIGKFGRWRNVCKKCIAVKTKVYREKHKEYFREKFKIWLSKNREQRKHYCKKWYKNNRKSYLKHKKEYTKILHKNKPWLKVLKNVKSRLHPISLKRKKNKSYLKIKNFLTENDVKFLWDKHNAILMKRPSIHRKNNKGHYTKNNCEFLELSEHLSLRR